MWCWPLYSVFFTNNCDVHFFLVVIADQTEHSASRRKHLATITHGKHPEFAMAIYTSHLPPIWPLGSGGTQAINRLKPMIMHPMIQKLSE
jgi:hypothetical protein